MILEGLDLILINCHLMGTNKYGVPETHFDLQRYEQLNRTYEILASTGKLQQGRNRVVLLGDLNFRTEVFEAPEAKVEIEMCSGVLPLYFACMLSWNEF